MKYLFIDYGATNIKSCIFSSSEDKFSNARVVKCPVSRETYPRHVLAIGSLSEITKEIIRDVECDAILISSQMHGFSIFDGKKVSDYVSWMDERGDVLNIPNHKNLTGLTPRKGLPVFNIPSINRENKYKDLQILSLPSAILKNIGVFENKVHNTISCGFGTHHINSQILNTNISCAIGSNISFSETTSQIEIVGQVLCGNKQTPVFSPVGDLQCAILGSNLKSGHISINLGTGSQVSLVSKSINQGTDNRSFFDDKYLNTITHIPSGRAINSYINFMKSLGYKKDFWETIKNSSVQDILSSTLDISLSTFGGNDGSIRGLREASMTCENFELSIIKNYVLQYKKHVEKLDGHSIVLSGGIVKNCPIIADVFRECFDHLVIVNDTKIEETFLGLKELTKRI